MSLPGSTDSLVSVITFSSVCRLPGLFDHFGVYNRPTEVVVPLRYIVVLISTVVISPTSGLSIVYQPPVRYLWPSCSPSTNWERGASSNSAVLSYKFSMAVRSHCLRLHQLFLSIIWLFDILNVATSVPGSAACRPYFHTGNADVNVEATKGADNTGVKRNI